ncbi:MAG: phosphatidylcholine/phosphatidylserine synthase [Alphaproteobacteria bacterium]|nr:phosphatidylcholine/phosphatidylserine synthase [Alphaproteobacteria bacterium]
MKQSEIKIRQVFPNAITMTALGFGVSSLNMAFWGQWKMAVLFIALSALFDFLDGGVARLLGAESKFGAQLDSLSDFVSFGVAPGFLMYQWTMDQAARHEALIGNAFRSEAVGIYWGFALFLAMCAAMRLARFNAMLESKNEQPKYWEHFFMGVPAPAGAGLAIFPLVLWLASSGQIDFFRSPWFVSFFLLFSGSMMASRIPTLCLKHLRIPEHLMTPLRIGLLFMLASLLAFPWIALSIIGILYLVSIPLGIRYFLKQKTLYKKG